MPHPSEECRWSREFEGSLTVVGLTWGQSGIFGVRPNTSFSFPLGKFATVFKMKYMLFFSVHVKI